MLLDQLALFLVALLQLFMPFPPPLLQKRCLHLSTEAVILIIIIGFWEVILYSHPSRPLEALLSLELEELACILMWLTSDPHPHLIMEALTRLHTIILVGHYLITILLIIRHAINIPFPRQRCPITLPWRTILRREFLELAMQSQNRVSQGHLLWLLDHHHK
jgi:hypothetical protein